MTSENRKNMMKVELPIKVKILAVVTLVLTLGLAIYISIAIDTFKRDKTELIFDLARSDVRDVTSQVEGSLRLSANLFQLFSQSYATFGPVKTRQVFNTIIQNDPVLVDIAIYKKDKNGSFKHYGRLSQNAFLQNYDLGPEFFENIVKTPAQIPFDKIKNQTVVAWNATLPKQAPLIGFGIRILQKDAKPTDPEMAVAGYLRADGFIKALNENSQGTTYVVDQDGNFLIHPDIKILSSSSLDRANPLFVKARSKTSKQGLLKYKTTSGEEFVGAYSNINFADLTTLSQIESVKAFAAIKQLIKRSLVFAMAVLTLTFLIILLFAKSLTEPLAELVKAMKKISNGDLSYDFKIKTRDEIGVLGRVFNQMTGDLKKSRSDLLNLNRSLEDKVKERTKQLEEAAIKDALTGLYNRRYFNDRLTDELNRSKRNKKPIGIVYLDIDHFKKFNDGNGHPQGDTLLKIFSNVISDAVRKTDAVCRLGGEEFCIILPETDISGSTECAEKVRKAIETHNFQFGEKQPLGRVTCSLGVSSYPDFGSDEEELVKIADEALYEAKESGRNKVGRPKKKRPSSAA